MTTGLQVTKSLADFITDLGLVYRNEYRLTGAGPHMELYVFDWMHDKRQGRKWDHFVYVLVYPDGTWTAALDDGCMASQAKAVFANMAKAMEQSLTK